MDLTISKLLEDFSNTPGQEYVLELVAEEMIIEKIMHLSAIDRYTVYFMVIAFPNRAIKHGKILLRRMLKLNIIESEYLQKELTDYKDSLPDWAREVMEEKFSN